MALSQSDLKQKLLQAFKNIQSSKSSPVPPPPLMSTVAAKELSNAYHTWVSNGPALAGALKISVPGQPTLIAAALSAAPLMQGWAPGLLAYWTPVIWTGPGFIPANPTVAAGVSGVAPAIVALMAGKPPSISAFADQLSSVLYTYTKLVMVTATTTATPPVVSTLPVS